MTALGEKVLTLSEREKLLEWRAEFLCAIAKGKPLDEVAKRVYKWVLELNSHSAPAMNSLGRLALQEKAYEVARRYFDAAAQLDPKDFRILLNAAVAADEAGDLDAAEDYAWRALGVNPETASPYMMLVSVAERRDRPDLMGRGIHAGLKLDPEHKDLLFARAFLELKRGDFKQGWADYENRSTRLEMLDRLDEVPEWRGQSLEGKTLLVAGEQGFGDQIMFARYLRELPPSKALYVYTRPEVARLFDHYNVITSDLELSKLDVDYWILMGSLPHVLRIDKPLAAPFPVAVRMDSWKRFHDLVPETGSLKVGLAWQGNPDFYRDSYRSLGTIERLKPLLEVPGCDFYSLQYGENESGLTNLTAYAQDWADTAAAIEQMDLVITTDTGVAHLAASLGTETRILLSRMSDWRWGLPSQTGWKLTPWYPGSTQIYQQLELGEWAEVIERVKKALEQKSEAVATATSPEINRNDRPNMGSSSYIIRKPSKWNSVTAYFANDRFIGRSLELYGEWSDSEDKLFRDLVKPGDIVVEAGANMGALTLPLADCVGTSGEVWAFEPVQATHALLLENTLPLPQVKTFRCGLASAAGSAGYRDSSTDPVANPGGTELGAEGHQQAELAALDWYALPRLDFFKIDVEGMELEVLKGAAETVARSQPIIYAENDREGSTEALLEWLTERGYRVYQHLAPLYNPDNFRGYRVNVFGGIHSFMLLALPRGRYLDQAVIDRHNLSRLRLGKRKN